MKIGLKLILGFLTISIIGGLVGYMGFNGSQDIIKTYNVIADETAPEIVVLGKIGLLSQQLQSATVSFVLINAELSVSGESAIAVVEELKEFEETNEKLDETILEFRQLGKMEVFEEIKESKTGLYNAALDLINAKKEGKMGQPIFSLKEKLEESGKDFEDIINGYITEGEKKLVTQGTIADELAANTTNLILIVSIGGIILAISLGVFISRLISSPVKNLEMAAKEMTKGNFDVELKSTSNDEIGEFAKLFGSMARAIKQVDIQKEEFSSMVTHELRTPLMPILSWSSALNQPKILGKLTSDQSHAVNKISANAKKLRTLIDDLLDAQTAWVARGLAFAAVSWP